MQGRLDFHTSHFDINAQIYEAATQAHCGLEGGKSNCHYPQWLMHVNVLVKFWWNLTCHLARVFPKNLFKTTRHAHLPDEEIEAEDATLSTDNVGNRGAANSQFIKPCVDTTNLCSEPIGDINDLQPEDIELADFLLDKYSGIGIE